ncbi:MAG: peptidoglycan DD-metalloendopeptidase family protein [Verrucomicrobia bacterium]|nr:peptidoglycan DD-metalloendopeptidase family protein [Verrucomicrobiota bacterium]
MIRRFLRPQVWLALLLCVTTSIAATTTDNDYVVIARRLIRHINADDQDKIHQMLASTLRGGFPEAKARVYFRNILAQRGKLVRVKDSVVNNYGGGVQVEAERGDWNFALTLDRKGLIASLNITPIGPLIALPERNKTVMRLPFDKDCYVAEGGATPSLNRHSNSRAQRNALDFTIRDAKGNTYTGEGKENKDYYIYGMDVLAPADGTVVMVVDGIPDNKPGTGSGFHAGGNCIMIKHSDSEFSVLAQMMPGSVNLKVGDAVKAGQPVGKCGNSGNADEPHLHFHLQNLPVMPEAFGFEPYFQNIRVTRDLKVRVERDYSPIRGDTVAPQPIEAVAPKPSK